MNLPDWILPVKILCHSPKVQDFCRLPYPGHPKGCPNYGVKKHCPPKAPYITKILDITKPMYLVFSTFDLAAHMRKMHRRHPKWTERQLRNVYYWQNTSRAQLRQRMLQVAMDVPTITVLIPAPEAYGVNMYVTCRHAGLPLEKIKHLKTCHHVGLIGSRYARPRTI